MKRVRLLWCFIILGGLISCKEKIGTQDTFVELTVRNSSGENINGITVYLFEQASNETEGQNPDYAIRSALSDENGLVRFDLSKLFGIENEPTLYFTVIEQPVSGEISVLGSVEITVKKNITTTEEIMIDEPKLKYANGYIPTTVAQDYVISEYQRWKSSQVVACNDGFRVIAEPANETRVEAIGFGMILSAYAKDKALFDGLLSFYKSKRTTQANYMMAWLVTCDDIIDPGSATDGDLDVAFALIVADKQWGGNYLQEAKDILSIIKTSLIEQCTVNGETAYIVGPGYSNGSWGGCELMDIQYFTPAFFRVFANVTGDNIWSELADDSYILLNASAHSVTGLVPDWQTSNGTPGPDGRIGYYGYDACRVPWRMALDYLWNGNTQSQDWCIKVSNWANSIGAANIVDGYELDGTPKGSYANGAFVGGFAVAAMCNSQNMVNVFGTVLNGINDVYWFNLNTRCLYLFALTGNFWDPLTYVK